MEISVYKPDDEQEILTAIKKDPNWDFLTNEKTIGSYRDSLRDSITYICRNDGEFTGFVRAILDKDIAIYISELFVVPKWRNQKIGRSLLERVKIDFPKLAVYALSDEDAYYEKLKYRKIGSVYQY
jgi:GNAT superfamily N-acetyltransferase